MSVSQVIITDFGNKLMLLSGIENYYFVYCRHRIFSIAKLISSCDLLTC